MSEFEKIIEVRWPDCDPNRHVRHSTYYDYGAHIRIRLFAELGYDSTKLSELNIGPILFKEECSFIREIRPDDSVRINMQKGDVSKDGSRWVIHHELFNQENVKCAHITVKGAWLDLGRRKLIKPPKPLTEFLLGLPEGQHYVYKKN